MVVPSEDPKTEEIESVEEKTVEKSTEKPVDKKGGRPVRGKKSPGSDEEAMDGEYEADEEEAALEPRRSTRGKRSYDQETGGRSVRKVVKKAKEVNKKPERAPSARGRGQKPAIGNDSTTEDGEEKKSGKNASDTDSDEEAKVVKRPTSGRMSGAPPSARMLALKKKNHDDSE